MDCRKCKYRIVSVASKAIKKGQAKNERKVTELGKATITAASVYSW